MVRHVLWFAFAIDIVGLSPFLTFVTTLFFRYLHLTALQNYKDSALGYGENHPITLRNTSNLAVILLREAEGLPKDKSKPIIDAAKFEMEGALQKFIALNDMWTYRLDVASLKTNLGFVAVWQGKPKKARKLLRQIQEIEVPETHPLVGRIGILEQRVEKLEKSKSK